MSPRGHLKTTIFSISYPIWRLWRENNFDICLVSSARDQSRNIMRTVQEKIEENEFLKHLVPEKRELSWNSESTETTNRNKFFIRPFNSTIRGTHVNIFLCDDVLREEGSTQEQVKEKFWSLIYPCINTRKGQLIVVGTPLTVDDLLSELQEKPGWNAGRWEAVLRDPDGNWLKPLWEERFTLEELKEIRANQGELKFDREYLCSPAAGGSAIFPDEIIKAQMKSAESLTRRGNCSYYLGVDVAFSPKSDADFTVMTVLEKDSKGLFWQIRMERYKGMNPNNQIDRIKELHDIFRFRKIIIEDRGLSQGMVIDAMNDPELKQCTEGFATSKNNKEEIISRLQGAMSSGILFILSNDILLRELRMFGVKKARDGKYTYESLGGHDDCVLSLSLAYEAASKKGSAGFLWV